MKDKNFQAKNYVPGLNSLGCGYDIFGLYANPESTTSKLFNFPEDEEINISGNTYWKYKGVGLIETPNASYQCSYGVSVKEYLKEIGNKASLSGEYNFFRASLDVDFNSSVYQKRIYKYTKLMDKIHKLRLTLPENSINLVKPEVKAALNNNSLIDPDKSKQKKAISALFDKYGTHFLNEIIVGAKCEYIAATNEDTIKTDLEISTVAKLSYQQLNGSISGEDSTTYKKDIQTFNDSSEITVNVYGGDPEYGKDISVKNNYEKWVDSIKGNPVFCDFTDKSLVPIWELCTNEDIKNALEEEYSIYADKKPKPIYQLAIAGVDVITSSKPDVQPSETGYIKIDKDLNEGAKGKYIYLCYKEELEKINVAITDLDIIVVDNPDEAASQLKPNYIKIDKDLNEGAGGKYIYLCYSKDLTKQNEPIRSIQIIQGDSHDIQPPRADYIKIDKDLNEGAKGEYIYLCYSKLY